MGINKRIYTCFILQFSVFKPIIMSKVTTKEKLTFKTLIIKRICMCADKKTVF